MYTKYIFGEPSGAAFDFYLLSAVSLWDPLSRERLAPVGVPRTLPPRAEYRSYYRIAYFTQVQN